MRIAILDDWQDTIRTLPCFDKVAGHDVTVWKDHTKDVDVLAERLKDTEALVLHPRAHADPGAADRAPRKLRIISQAGVYPHIDVEACTRRGIIVSSTTGSRPAVVRDRGAERGGSIIAAMRRIPQEMAALKAGKWQAYPIGIGLRGKTLGIFGYGKIGAVVARVRQGVRHERARVGPRGVAREGAQGRLRRRRRAGRRSSSSRTSSRCTCGSIPETRGIVTAADLARMKPTALFVNTSRAGLVAPGALEAALRAGRPGWRPSTSTRRSRCSAASTRCWPWTT